MRSPAFLVTASLLTAGCQIESYDPVPPAQPSSLAASLQAAHERMHARFGAARRMEEAIARSDLDRAHAEAHDLAGLAEPEVLAMWRPYFESIRDAARQVELSSDVIAAAKLSANLGRECAQCHEAIKARIKYPAERQPPDDPKLATKMMGHQWAAAQMWEGLIGPSEDRWNTGARALTTVPLDIVAQAVTPSSELDVDDVARIRLFANRALITKPQDARAELYGKLLATCAHCHALLRDR